MNRTSVVPVLVLTLSTAVVAARADSVKERTLTLKFVPQETTGSSSPTLGEGVSVRAVSLAFEDKRPSSEVGIAGEGTDDGDHVFPWRSATPIPDFAKEVFVRTIEAWGVRIEDGVDLKLVVQLTRFYVTEKDQAVGSTYSADVRAAFELKGHDGTLLSSGVASGSSRRYGRKRSAENCNEVLSDAMKAAYANLLDHPDLQAAWSGKETRSSTKPQPISPSSLLRDLTGLTNQGFGPELLIHYVNQQTLSAPLSAQDLVEWKKAGLPESVIQAALDRSPVAR